MTDATMMKTEGAKMKKKGKGKQREEETAAEVAAEKLAKVPKGYTKVDNDGRCASCKVVNVVCQINLVNIDRWRDELDEETATGRTPTGVNCWRCKVKKKKCELPATAELRRRATGVLATKEAEKAAEERHDELRRGSVTPSAASSHKRGREVFDGVELPESKRRMTRMAAPSSVFSVKALTATKTAEEMQRELLGAIVGLGRQMADVATAVRESTAAQDARTQVLHALLAGLVQMVTPQAETERVERSVAPVASGSGLRAPVEDIVVEIPIEDATGDDVEEDSGPKAEAEVTDQVAGEESEEGSEEEDSDDDEDEDEDED